MKHEKDKKNSKKMEYLSIAFIFPRGNVVTYSM